MTSTGPDGPSSGVSDAIPVVLDAAVGGLVGLAAGLLFFSGLWWTARRLPTAGNPGLLVFVSFVLRTALVLAAFGVLVSVYDSSTPLLTAVAAFLIVRILVVRKLGRPPASAAPSTRSPRGTSSTLPDPDGGT